MINSVSDSEHYMHQYLTTYLLNLKCWFDLSLLCSGPMNPYALLAQGFKKQTGLVSAFVPEMLTIGTVSIKSKSTAPPYPRFSNVFNRMLTSYNCQ